MATKKKPVAKKATSKRPTAKKPTAKKATTKKGGADKPTTPVLAGPGARGEVLAPTAKGRKVTVDGGGVVVHVKDSEGLGKVPGVENARAKKKAARRRPSNFMEEQAIEDRIESKLEQASGPLKKCRELAKGIGARLIVASDGLGTIDTVAQDLQHVQTHLAELADEVKTALRCLDD